jgi:hypothetical protein
VWAGGGWTITCTWAYPDCASAACRATPDSATGVRLRGPALHARFPAHRFPPTLRAPQVLAPRRAQPVGLVYKLVCRPQPSLLSPLITPEPAIVNAIEWHGLACAALSFLRTYACMQSCTRARAAAAGRAMGAPRLSAASLLPARSPLPRCRHF